MRAWRSLRAEQRIDALRNRERGAAFFRWRLRLHAKKHGCAKRAPSKEMIMGNLLHYALVFLVVALVAAAIGFGGVAGVAMEGARMLFWVFIIMAVVTLVAGAVRRSFRVDGERDHLQPAGRA